jgi:23S rRNA (cytosine1962-C5)-methyltransferase
MLKTTKLEPSFLNSFVRLKDPLIKPLFENESLFIVNKPYGMTTHSYGETAVQDGIKEVFEKAYNVKLFVIHRLDVTTTGVLVFAKNKEAAADYTKKFSSRAVKKRYLFLTAARSQKDSYECSELIDKQEALTKFCRLKRTTKYELWEALPLTGRTHQIRKHAQFLGLAILGDEKYGGESFPALCLHCERLEFSKDEFFWAYPPRYFERLWILHKLQAVQVFIEIDRRLRLYKFLDKEFELQSIRLAHSKKLKYTLDKVGKILVLSWYDKIESLDLSLWAYIAYHLGWPVYVKSMIDKGVDSNSKSTIWISHKDFEVRDLDYSEAREDNLKYRIKFDQGHSVGLFLDQRAQRHFVQKISSDKKVLNLFSYTSLFSVAAALGSASEVHSVDLSKKYLDWSKENFSLNSVEIKEYKFFYRDCVEYLNSSKKNNINYDVIICDPPSFSRSNDGKVFKVEKDYEKLILLCLSVLTKSGILIFSCNFEKWTLEDLYLRLKKTLNKERYRVQTLVPALDYEMTSTKADLKSYIISKK